MASFPYEYSENITPPPFAPGIIHANAAWDVSAVTALFVSTTPAGAPALVALQAGDLVRLELYTDAAWWHEWTVAGIPVHDALLGAVTIPVSGGTEGEGAPYGYTLLALPDTALPGAALGPRDVYASMSDLEAVIGASAGESQVRRRELCLIAATRWVAHRIGVPATDELLDAGSSGVQLVPAKASWATATLEAAVRFYKGPDVPWGVAGGWDEAVYVRQSMPEVELILFGQRVAWGVA